MRRPRFAQEGPRCQQKQTFEPSGSAFKNTVEIIDTFKKVARNVTFVKSFYLNRLNPNCPPDGAECIYI